MPASLVARLEGLSGYRHVYPPSHELADHNPVCWSHVRFAASGRPVDLLSRIAAHGVDYSGRTNKLAHHLVLNPREQPPAGPAWLLMRPGVMRTGWDGRIDTPPQGPSVPMGDQDAPSCETWRSVTGDAGWGKVVTKAFADPVAKPLWLIYTSGHQEMLLKLINESISLLPPSQRWAATFSTYFTSLPPEIDCRLRCVLAGTEEARIVAKQPGVIDLSATLPPAPKLANISDTGSAAMEVSPTSAEPPETVGLASTTAPGVGDLPNSPPPPARPRRRTSAGPPIAPASPAPPPRVQRGKRSLTKVFIAISSCVTIGFSIIPLAWRLMSPTPSRNEFASTTPESRSQNGRSRDPTDLTDTPSGRNDSDSSTSPEDAGSNEDATPNGHQPTEMESSRDKPPDDHSNAGNASEKSSSQEHLSTSDNPKVDHTEIALANDNPGPHDEDIPGTASSPLPDDDEPGNAPNEPGVFTIVLKEMPDGKVSISGDLKIDLDIHGATMFAIEGGAKKKINEPISPKVTAETSFDFPGMTELKGVIVTRKHEADRATEQRVVGIRVGIEKLVKKPNRDATFNPSIGPVRRFFNETLVAIAKVKTQVDAARRTALSGSGSPSGVEDDKLQGTHRRLNMYLEKTRKAVEGQSWVTIDREFVSVVDGIAVALREVGNEFESMNAATKPPDIRKNIEIMDNLVKFSRDLLDRLDLGPVAASSELVKIEFFGNGEVDGDSPFKMAATPIGDPILISPAFVVERSP